MDMGVANDWSEKNFKADESTEQGDPSYKSEFINKAYLV